MVSGTHEFDPVHLPNCGSGKKANDHKTKRRVGCYSGQQDCITDTKERLGAGGINFFRNNLHL